MVTPAAKRKAVDHLRDAFGMSERRACKAIGCCRMYEDALRLTERNPDDFRIAVLHHHLIPASREERTDPNYKEAAISVTAVDPARHIPVLKDAIALIDAMLDHGARLLTIEQIALSECLRIHGIFVATMYPVFGHYYRVAHKRYMQSQLRCWAAGQRTGFEPQPPTIQYSRFRVRYFRIAARLTAMIGKDVEAQMRWR
ncbi:hypothetical protein AB4Z51_13270 [Bradyrhizobium sp. 2TAF36]